jgi:hypothetical protein
MNLADQEAAHSGELGKLGVRVEFKRRQEVLASDDVLGSVVLLLS